MTTKVIATAPGSPKPPGPAPEPPRPGPLPAPPNDPNRPDRPRDPTPPPDAVPQPIIDPPARPDQHPQHVDAHARVSMPAARR